LAVGAAFGSSRLRSTTVVARVRPVAGSLISSVTRMLLTFLSSNSLSAKASAFWS